MIKINDDAMSDIGCSIASGVIAEYFINNDIKDKTLYINARTLYRNFTGCIDGCSADKIAEFKSARGLSDILNLFILDTTIWLEALFNQGIEVVIYIPDYSKVIKEWGNPLQSNKLKGLRYEVNRTEKIATDLLLKEFPAVAKEVKYSIKYVKDMYVTTHIGLDLLSFKPTQKVNLIESHTAEIKTYTKWYSKFHKLGKHDMSIMPFNSLIYRILGDGIIVQPAGLDIRRFIYKTAIESKWDSKRTIPSVLVNIKSKNVNMFTIIQKMISRLF